MNVLTIKLCTHAKMNHLKELIICIKMDFALNNQERLNCHQTQTPNPTFFIKNLFFNGYSFILRLYTLVSYNK